MGNEFSPNCTTNYANYVDTHHKQSQKAPTMLPRSPNDIKTHSRMIQSQVAGGKPFINTKQPGMRESLPANFNVGKYGIRSQSGSIQRPIETTKIIYIENENGAYRIEIPIVSTEESGLTCGWLVSETIRRFTNMNSKAGRSENFSNLVMLQTKDNLYTVDFWLSHFERSVSVLTDKMVLTPFFGDSEYELGKKKINLTYFTILKLIGTGGFSKVYLARRKDNGRFYAIKVISKRDMMQKDKEESVFNEKNLMTRLDHPFLVKLHFAFQSKKNLYLVMDFVPGGELFYHLQRKGKLNEEETKTYAGQIILCLNYLHKNNIIYRDLKPENILVDVDGHLLLADFGLCKTIENRNSLNYSFCGSPEYLAPEMVAKTGYTFTLDYYCLGVLIYELVAGCPPFYSENRTTLYENIMHRDVYYPSHISPTLKNFLSKLLAKNPLKRLGAKGGLTEIINHPWCQTINFAKLIMKKYKCPLVPDPYKLNFDDEFVGATFADLEEDANAVRGEFKKLSIKTLKSVEQNLLPYQKFANFSFYSNMDDEAQNKYVDDLFHSPRVNMDLTPFASETELKSELEITYASGFKSALKKSSSMQPGSPKALKKLSSGEEFSELSSGLHQSVYIAAPPKVTHLRDRVSVTVISSNSSNSSLVEEHAGPQSYQRILPNGLRNIHYHDQFKKESEQAQRPETTARINSAEDRKDQLRNTPNPTAQKLVASFQEQKEDDKENNRFKKNTGHTLSITAYNYAYAALKKNEIPKAKTETHFSPSKLHGTSELKPKFHQEEVSDMSPINSPPTNPTMKKISEMRFSDAATYKDRVAKSENSRLEDTSFNRNKPNRIKVKQK